MRRRRSQLLFDHRMRRAMEIASDDGRGIVNGLNRCPQPMRTNMSHSNSTAPDLNLSVTHGNHLAPRPIEDLVLEIEMASGSDDDRIDAALFASCRAASV
jgi:hypothetical protein